MMQTGKGSRQGGHGGDDKGTGAPTVLGEATLLSDPLPFDDFNDDEDSTQFITSAQLLGGGGGATRPPPQESKQPALNIAIDPQDSADEGASGVSFWDE